MPVHTPLSPKKQWLISFRKSLVNTWKNNNKVLFSVWHVSWLPVPESLSYVLLNV